MTLDGHEGLYLELSTPTRFDYQACGPDGMQIWQTGVTDPRALGEPTTDRYWIMDVDGQRVVIAAMTGRAARQVRSFRADLLSRGIGSIPSAVSTRTPSRPS